MSRTRIATVALLLAVCTHSGTTADKKPTAKSPAKTAKKLNWLPLFDGKSLAGWQITKFGGEGDVSVKKGRLLLGFGSDITGVHTKRPLPKIDYEVELEAMRVDGGDFFCGLTFPVEKSHCSLIVGGWGGGVCGLSSINDMDASENETTTYRGFDKGKWYPIRLKVTKEKIEAWLEGKQIVDQKLKGKKVSTRIEVDLSKPFGFSTWQTTGALRNIRIRRLDGKQIVSPIKPVKKR